MSESIGFGCQSYVLDPDGREEFPRNYMTGFMVVGNCQACVAGTLLSNRPQIAKIRTFDNCIDRINASHESPCGS